jgi:hypothetical protein
MREISVSQFGIDILLRLRDAIRINRPVKWRFSSRWLLHHNAPAHRSVLAKISYQMTKWQLCRIPLFYQAAADFFLLSELKPAQKGGRFCDAADRIKNAPEELKRTSQKGFLENFQTTFYSHWQKCITAQEVCFKGNMAEIFLLFCFSEIKWFLECSEIIAYVWTLVQIKVKVTL